MEANMGPFDGAIAMAAGAAVVGAVVAIAGLARYVIRRGQPCR